MPPCHGGDRRFESGQARQTKCPISDGIFCLEPVSDLNRVRRSRGKAISGRAQYVDLIPLLWYRLHQMNFESDPTNGEIRTSPELRDIALAHVPEVARERKLGVFVTYHLSSFRFIEISYHPDEEDPDDKLLIDLVEAKPTFPVPELDEASDSPTQYGPVYVGTRKRCWVDPDTGKIGMFMDRTGELVDGTTFVEDRLFDQNSAFGRLISLDIGLDLPMNPFDHAVADLNDDLEVLTQAKLDVILSAFKELDEKLG